MRSQKRNVLLFVDNAPSHPRATMKNVKRVFLPANTTSIYQPMDQGIIQTIKLKIPAKQLQYTNDQLPKDSTIRDPEKLRTISVLDAIYWVGKVWELVEPLTMQKCFAKAGFVHAVSDKSMRDSTADVEIPLLVLWLSKDLFGCDYEKLPDIDSHVQICQPSTDWDLQS